jgi:hypothetical protein
VLSYYSSCNHARWRQGGSIILVRESYHPLECDAFSQTFPDVVEVPAACVLTVQEYDKLKDSGSMTSERLTDFYQTTRHNFAR